MKPPIVDQIMQGPVFTVDAGDTVDSALKAMESHGTKKILVTEGGKPKGILERWMVTSNDSKRPAGDMELQPFGRVRLGSDIDKIQSEIRRFSAVYVFDPEKPDDPVGVVTSFDLLGAL